MMKNLLLIFLTALVASCGGGSSSRQEGKPSADTTSQLSEPYHVTLDPRALLTEGAPVLSDVVDSLEYIPLETRNDILIGPISQVWITDDFLFVYPFQGMALHQYSRNGKFIRCLGAVGRGPGEYLSIRGLHVDENKHVVYVVVDVRRVYKYDYLTGIFLGSTTIQFPAGEGAGKAMPLYDNKVVFIPAGDPYFLPEFSTFFVQDFDSSNIVYRKKSTMWGYEIQGRQPEPGSFRTISTYCSIWAYPHSQINYWETASDTIYRVNPDYSSTPRYVFDMGKYKKGVDDFPHNRSELQKYLETAHQRIELEYSPKETERYLLFGFAFDRKECYYAFDKQTGVQYLAYSEPLGEYAIRPRPFLGLFNDIDGGFSQMDTDSYIEGNWVGFYDALTIKTLLTPEHFQQVKGKVKYPDRMKRLQAFVDKLDEEDNPVIVIAHLKRNKNQ